MLKQTASVLAYVSLRRLSALRLERSDLLSGTIQRTEFQSMRWFREGSHRWCWAQIGQRSVCPRPRCLPFSRAWGTPQKSFLARSYRATHVLTWAAPVFAISPMRTCRGSTVLDRHYKSDMFDL